WNCGWSAIGVRRWARRPASKLCTAGCPGRRWWRPRSPEAEPAGPSNSLTAAAAHFDNRKREARHGDGDRHGKRTEGKGLVATGADAGHAARGAKNVGQ